MGIVRQVELLLAVGWLLSMRGGYVFAKLFIFHVYNNPIEKSTLVKYDFKSVCDTTELSLKAPRASFTTSFAQF